MSQYMIMLSIQHNWIESIVMSIDLIKFDQTRWVSSRNYYVQQQKWNVYAVCVLEITKYKIIHNNLYWLKLLG